MNGPAHIPQMIGAATVAAALHERDRRIAELEADVAAFGASHQG